MSTRRFPFLLCLALTSLLASCGSRSSSRQESGINGTYVYQDGISRSTVTISGSRWTMETQFGTPGNYGRTEHDSGVVKGSTLYYSGIIEYGTVSGRTLRLAGRTYQKK